LNALGDGINVAQRVMSFAAPNQVLVSQSYFEVVSRMSDDYKGLFRYDSVRKDKHIREHVVYELSPAGPGTSAVSVPAVEEEEISTGIPEKPVVAARRSFLLPVGIGALALGGFLLLRPKTPADNPQSTASPVAQVQQGAPPPVGSGVTPAAAGAAGAKSVEAPRTNPGRSVSETATIAPRRDPPPAAGPSIERSQVSRQPAAAESEVDLAGMWQADVKYSWGDSHSEVINLKVDHGEVFGTASYVRTPRAIVDGKVEGTKLTFTTKSQTMLGDKMFEEKHVYRGRVSGDAIEFILQTDSGYDSRPPEMFTARRVAAGATGR
jgi:hypothetical protein